MDHQKMDFQIKCSGNKDISLLINNPSSLNIGKVSAPLRAPAID